VALRTEIDARVKKLINNQQNVKLFRHIGDSWYASVNTGFVCVDIRKFECHPELRQKTDIALYVSMK
jgi:hypothetical protein